MTGTKKGAMKKNGGKDKYYRVDKIVGCRLGQGGNWEYKLRWKNLGRYHDSWVASKNLNNQLYQEALVYKKKKPVVVSRSKTNGVYYAVQEIVSCRRYGGDLMCKVRWMNLGKNKDSWVPQKNLSSTLLKEVVTKAKRCYLEVEDEIEQKKEDEKHLRKYRAAVRKMVHA